MIKLIYDYENQCECETIVLNFDTMEEAEAYSNVMLEKELAFIKETREIFGKTSVFIEMINDIEFIITMTNDVVTGYATLRLYN